MMLVFSFEKEKAFWSDPQGNVKFLLLFYNSDAFSAFSKE